MNDPLDASSEFSLTRARAAAMVLEAVIAARIVVADAVSLARLLRDSAADAAADLAADQAAQDAVALRYREDAAAIQVQQAAGVAALVVWRSESDPVSYGAQFRAAGRAETLQAGVVATAAAVLEQNAAVALAVASGVSARAQLVAAARLSSDLRFEADVAAAAAAVEVLAADAAAAMAAC